jgi:hypothetical protein
MFVMIQRYGFGFDQSRGPARRPDNAGREPSINHTKEKVKEERREYSTIFHARVESHPCHVHDVAYHAPILPPTREQAW